MKFTKLTYRYHDYSSINKLNKDSEDFIGKFITTKYCEFGTGYYQRGCPAKQCIIPAGTEVSFSLRQYKDGNGIFCDLAAETPWKFDTGETLKVSKHHRLDMSFEDAMKKFGLQRDPSKYKGGC